MLSIWYDQWHLILLLWFETSEVRLVGGSGPHEGNILVGGRPVCDDHHDAQNARVVCRFPKNRGNFKCIFPFCISFIQKTTEKFFQGCWGTLMGNIQTNLSLDQSLALSRWTMCSARAKKRPSLTALISLWIIVVPLRGQASSAQILVGYFHYEQMVEKESVYFLNVT